MRTRFSRELALRFSVALLVASARSARADDMLLRPATGGVPSPSWAPHAALSEVVEDVEERLVHSVHPGESPRPQVTRRDVITRIDDRPLHFFRGVQVRHGASADHVLGPASPVDRVSGVLPGTLLAFRVGAEGGLLGAYTIAGAGTFTAYRHGTPRGDGEPIQVTTRSVPYGFVGVGAQLRLHRTALFAAEVDWGRIAVGRSDRVLSPDPTDVVRTAVFALLFEY